MTSSILIKGYKRTLLKVQIESTNIEIRWILNKRINKQTNKNRTPLDDEIETCRTRGS